MRRILFEIPLPFEIPHLGRYLPIHSFGVMAALGFLAALWVALDRGRREKLKETVIWDIWTVSLIAGLAGARLVYVIEQWGALFAGNFWEVFKVWHGGLVWYGGVAGAFLWGALYLRARRQLLLPVADAVAPAAMIGLAFGRVGCFLNGCCGGKPSSLPWAVIFPQSGVPVHPTQLYSSATALIIFLLLTAYYPRRKRPGEVFFLMLILYGAARFLIEGLRTNAEVWMGLSLAQVMSLVMVPVALGFFFQSRMQPARATV